MSDTNVPAQAHPNLFKPIGVLMQAIPDSLAGVAQAGAPPRYVRIARLRKFLKENPAEDPAVAGALAKAVGFFVQGVCYILKFSLKLEELLEQGDAGKALFETATDLVDQVTKDEFLDSLKEINDEIIQAPGFNLEAIKSISTPIGQARRFVSYIPTPEDFAVIEQQLYRLLAVEYLPAPANWTTETSPVVLERTGKLRVLVWALGRQRLAPIEAGATEQSVLTLGLRRLRKGTDLATKSAATWQASEAAPPEPVFERSFPVADSPDISELNTLLRAYGYFTDVAAKTVASDGAFDDATERAVAQFQHLNGLPKTGTLGDAATVNQLLHLRTDADPLKCGIRRAVTYDKAKLEADGFVWPKP